MAWGVSSYGKIYNWLFFLQRLPRRAPFPSESALTKMEGFHRQIADLQKQEGVRVIGHAHMLGFLDPNLPKRGQRAASLESTAQSAQ
jgi:hypothetical protein